MNILIAPDSFKDALSSKLVASAISSGLKLADSTVKIEIFPLGDGGEGSSEILGDHLNAVKIPVTVSDPLGRPIEAFFYWSAKTKTAIIEMAEASGLQLLTEEERNPMETSTYGTGELIKEALKMDAKNIVLAIGGSATNDGGIGMAAALGYKFFDKDGNQLKGKGKDLTKIHYFTDNDSIIPDKLHVDVMCDVENPLFGEKGAAYVYAKQKGANEKEINELNEGLKNLNRVVKQKLNQDVSQKPGMGAAGGLGFGSVIFLNATLQKGIDVMLDLTNFDERLKHTDLVITGEGKMDVQTMHGKLIDGVAKRAAKYNIPVIGFCGVLNLSPENISDIGLEAAFSVRHDIVDLDVALANTEKDLISLSYNVMKLLKKTF